MEEGAAPDLAEVAGHKWQYRTLGLGDLHEMGQQRDALSPAQLVALDEVLTERGLRPVAPPPPPDYHGLRGFLAQHWRGDFGLARSYWLHLLLLSVVASKALEALVTTAGPELKARYVSLAVLLGTAVTLAVWIWGIVGTWASAGKHAARGGRAFWGGAARVAIVFGVLSNTASMLALGPLWVEHVRVAWGEQPGAPVQFVVRADGKSLLLHGGINDDSAEGLEQALQRAPGVKTVVLESGGGWISQGKRLAEVISRRGLATYVETECSSACTIAFLGGRDRALAPHARLGFHAFSTIGAAGVHPIDTEQDVYGRAGLSPAFIRHVVDTSPKRIWYPDHEQLLREHVLTRASEGGETAALATQLNSRDAVVLFLAKDPLLAAVKRRYPEPFSRTVDAAWQAMRQHKTDREVREAIHAEALALVSTLLREADDATMRTYLVFLADEAQELASAAPRACAWVVFGKLAGGSGGDTRLSDPLVQREARLMRSVVETSAPRNRLQPATAEVRETYQQLFATMRPADVVGVRAVLAGTHPPPASACHAGMALLDAIMAQPYEHRARATRILFAS